MPGSSRGNDPRRDASTPAPRVPPPPADDRRASAYLVSTRSAFRERWWSPCVRVGLRPESTLPATLPDRFPGAAVLLVDGCAPPFTGDEDELLAVVALGRSAGLPTLLVWDDGNPPAAATEELLREMTHGLVHREPEPGTGTDPSSEEPLEAARTRLAGALARRLDGGRARRFELVTTTPRGDGLLTVRGDGQAERWERPLGPEDDGSEIVRIDLAPDARSAELTLTSGARVRVYAAHRESAPTTEAAAADGTAVVSQGAPGLGERVRRLRRAAGITQAELARRTGIHRPNIARVEAGRHMPSLGTLAKIADAIGLSLAEMLAEDGERGDDQVAGGRPRRG